MSFWREKMNKKKQLLENLSFSLINFLYANKEEYKLKDLSQWVVSLQNRVNEVLMEVEDE
jgi:hypothetical protein